jgi:hypothetical protein
MLNGNDAMSIAVGVGRLRDTTFDRDKKSTNSVLPSELAFGGAFVSSDSGDRFHISQACAGGLRILLEWAVRSIKVSLA